jgi:hypothetical protein
LKIQAAKNTIFVFQMNIKSFSFFAVLFLFGQLNAQNSKDTSTNRVMVIGLKYQPILIEAYKIESVPVINKPTPQSPNYTYQIPSKQVETPKIVNPMPAADFFKKETFEYPSSYVKLGYGNYKTPLAELYFNNKKDEKYSYGAHYKFLQTNSHLNKGFADFTDHNAKAYLRTYSRAGELGMELSFNQYDYNFFGFNDTLDLTRNDLKRRIKNFDALAYFNSTPNSKNKIKHRSSFNFNQFQIDQVSEANYAVKSKIYSSISNFNDLQNVVLSAQLGLNYMITKLDTNTTFKRLFIQVDPRFDFVYDDLKFSVGFNSTIFFNGNDTAQPFINPVIKVTYPLIKDVANLFGGIDGRYHQQSARNLINTNPFVNRYDLTNTFDNVRLYAGISAKVGSSADALFEINYTDISNMPLFVTRYDSVPRLNAFTTIFRQVNVVKFSGAFNYSFSEKFRIGVLGNFYNYSVNREAAAWQMPDVDAKVNLKMNIKNKIYPHLDFVAMGAQQQRTGLTEATKSFSKIDAFYDLSAGIDFKFKKKISLFVQANNIMSTRYQRWYNYQVLGFNLIGGLTMLF